ncbi:1,2-phenylacetyl-CoA epoxidase subunit PaaD [Sneathiella limimaris]|uniref:1,2-phenylacetyl-CoA epoxidase subunit PaaD n=1 Tax=Sneathiella limimaris TaxID=1964213 RepID=UPI00146D13A3|nr:1,2-phenylacetyl-CoA epoxidase subunit PaaD [Sneathiella limimaris]
MAGVPEPTYTADAVGQVLELVKDPEIPVLSIADMGIINSIDTTEGAVTVRITPTYSGCPAMDQISSDIKTTLKLHGYDQIEVETVLSPAWTTDFISEKGRQQLFEYGIAPPLKGAGKASLLGEDEIKCPQCGSTDTEQVSQFGSTACKALYRCKSCAEPFDYFKCV